MVIEGNYDKNYLYKPVEISSIELPTDSFDSLSKIKGKKYCQINFFCNF